MKICNWCKILKETIAFNAHRGTRDKLRAECKDCIKLYNKNYFKANRAHLSEKNAKWAKNNPDKIKESNKCWERKRKRKNTEERRQYQLEYGKENRAKLTAQQRTRIENDPCLKLKKTLRNRLLRALKGEYKSGSAVNDLGCSIVEFKIYFESLFQLDMCWENHGQWHIDHIIPLSSFDLSDRKQLLKACHFTNLQPLWASENIRKSNKIVA